MSWLIGSIGTWNPNDPCFASKRRSFPIKQGSFGFQVYSSILAAEIQSSLDIVFSNDGYKGYKCFVFANAIE